MDAIEGQVGTVRAVRVVVVDPRSSDYTALLKLALRLEFLPCGRDALQLVRTFGPDLWVIHVALPDMSGLDLWAMLRSHSPGSVIYMVTDEYRAEDERVAWGRGAALFGCKPIQESWFTDWCQPRRGCAVYQ